MGPDLFDGHWRRHDLGEQVAGTFALFGAVWVEARIGKQTEGADFDEIRRAAEIGDLGFHRIPSWCGLVGDERSSGRCVPLLQG